MLKVHSVPWGGYENGDERVKSVISQSILYHDCEKNTVTVNLMRSGNFTIASWKSMR